MRLPPAFTTVTPFSKLLALFLFILFPLVGFKLGMEYQRLLNQTQVYQVKYQIFPSQEECQKSTRKVCDVQICDFVPKGKTLEETCGKDFKKGWVPSSENNISPTPADDMANWKTYTNDKYRFEFKYPPTWNIQNVSYDSPPCTEFNCDTSIGYDGVKLSSDVDGATINIYKIQNYGKSIEEYFQEKNYTIGDSDRYSSYLSDKIVNGIPVTVGKYLGKTIYDPPLDIPIASIKITWNVFQIGNNIYLIDKTIDSRVDTREFEKKYDQILSTFRFLEEE